MSNTQIKIGLIGAGYWGKNLLRVLNKLNVLEVVCDLDKNILEERKKEYPNVNFTENFSDILNNKEIKAVVISAPAALHHKLCKQALLAKKDVFVEKPLALNVKDGQELVQLAEEMQRVLMVGHLLLYHPALIKLEEIVRNGDLGEIFYIYSNRLNFGKLRREENVLWSFAPHDVAVIIDIMQGILGLSKKIKVTASGRCFLQKNIPDVTLSSFEFENGKSAHVFVSWLNPFKEQKLCVVGSKAMAVFDDQAKDKLVIYNHKVEKKDNGQLEAIKSEGIAISYQEKEPLFEEVSHFLECVNKRLKPKTDGIEGLAVLEVLDACQRSIDENGKIIQIN